MQEQNHFAYVFKPLKQRLTVLGLGGKEAVCVLATAAVGALLAWSLGGWTHAVTVPVSETEQSNQYAKLESQRAAMQRAEAAEKEAEAGHGEARLSQSDQDAVAAGLAAGISAASSDEELRAKVETEKISQAPVVADVPRWMAFFFAPTLAVAAVNAELFHNSTILKEARRLARNARAQHDFPSDGEEWMERHEGKGGRR